MASISGASRGVTGDGEEDGGRSMSVGGAGSLDRVVVGISSVYGGYEWFYT